MIDVFDGQIEFILVPFRRPTVLRAAIREDSIERNVVQLEERQPAIIQQFGGCDRRLPIIQLREADLAVGIDEGLLIDPADALKCADVEGVLRTTLSRTFALEFPVRFFIRLCPLQGHHLGFG
jgi:hypothetical protein